jgi:hypothetical protein
MTGRSPDKASPMSKPDPRLLVQSPSLPVAALFREPAGIVCLALVLAMAALATRIVGAW